MSNKVRLDIELEVLFGDEGVEIYPYIDGNTDSEDVIIVNWDALYMETVNTAFDCGSIADTADKLEEMADRLRQYILDN
jgi:hypothetical protein|tara:strand:- start:13664 stop:13900 length:237 start_codon:yes stop_codon:yes gene_type:complete